jgi:hypothetical protein
VRPSDPEHSPSTATPVEVAVLVVIAGGAAYGATRSNQTGPVLAFAAALIVATIAAVTAARRLGQQLAAERERTLLQLEAEDSRLQRQLAAEGERQDAQLVHARELADLADLRALLDEAAVALHRARYTLDEVRSNLSSYSFGFFKSEERAKPYRDLEPAGQELDALRERLAVRLGASHYVVEHFTLADAAALEIYRAIGLLQLEDDPQDEAGRHSVRDFMKQTRERVQTERADFDMYRQAFMEAAQSVAGAKL